MEVQAHPAATAIDPANPASSLVDPMTGQVAQGGFVTKFVRPDYTLADTAEDPNLIQVPMEVLRSEVLKAPQVRFLPATAKDIWDAEGVLLGAYRPLGEIRRNWPKGVPTAPEQLAEMCRYYPEETDDLVPGGKPTRDALTSKDPDESTLVWTVTTYWKAGGRFPKGFYAVAAGEGTLLARDLWYDTRNNKRLDIPVDQLRQFADPDNAHGSGFFSILGAGNEIRNAQLGGMLEHQDRFLNRKIFYPVNSSLQAKSQQALTGTYIPVSPGGQPTSEQVPPFPEAIMDMFNLISSEMDSESGVQPPATGQNPPSVQSAIHARTIIEQVNVGLSELRSNVIRGMTRGWRIMLQLVRWRYTQPRRISWTGDDGAFKERNWTASDLGATDAVQLKTGSLSMLSPSAKAAVAEQLFGIRDPENRSVISLEELRSIIVGNVGGLLGLQDDPQRQRIRRQIEQWVLGPPQDWQPPPLVAPQIDPMTGAPLGPPMPAPDPVSMAIFAPRPSDDEPEIARVRAFELGRLLASTRFDRWPDPWKQAVLQEYVRMRQAAGIQTVAEQQQAAMQQQQMATAQTAAPGQAQPAGVAMQSPPSMPPMEGGVGPESQVLPAAPVPGPSPEIAMVQQQLADLSGQVQGLAQQVALSHAQPQVPGQPIVVNIQPSPVAQTVRVMADGMGGYTLEKVPAMEPDEAELEAAGATEP